MNAAVLRSFVLAGFRLIPLRMAAISWSVWSPPLPTGVPFGGPGTDAVKLGATGGAIGTVAPGVGGGGGGGGVMVAPHSNYDSLQDHFKITITYATQHLNLTALH